MAAIPVLLLARPSAFTTEAAHLAAPACLVILVTDTSVLMLMNARKTDVTPQLPATILLAPSPAAAKLAIMGTDFSAHLTPLQD